MLQDLKYSLRQLGRQPFFTILAALTLALGIGVSTALFSVIDAALLRPLPYPNPEELVTLNVKEAREDATGYYSPSMEDIRRWRTLDRIIAHAGMGRVSGFQQPIVETATPQRLIVAEASEDFLETYGITPILGPVSTDVGTRVGGPQRTVLPGYFESVGVTPIAGRLLADADRVANDAVVVSTSFARMYFGGNALGHTLRIGDAKHQRSLRIVGVVPDIKHRGPQGRHEPQMYMLPDPNANPALFRMRLAIVMRLRDGASLSIERLKQVAESVGPRVLVGEARPAAAFISQLVAAPRQRMLLLTLLGIFGLLLTLVGIFSMTAYAVARRTREIGVRVAVGASPTQVVAAMIGGAVGPVVFGLAAGMAGTYYATRIITRFLFQTDPGDPVTLASVVAVVGTGMPCRLAAGAPRSVY